MGGMAQPRRQQDHGTTTNKRGCKEGKVEMVSKQPPSPPATSFPASLEQATLPVSPPSNQIDCRPLSGPVSFPSKVKCGQPVLLSFLSCCPFRPVGRPEHT